MSKIVGLDFDDVVVDTEKFKADHKPYCIEQGLNIYEALELSLENLNFREGAIVGLQMLTALGFQPKIITARSGAGLLIPQTLLQRNGLDIPIIGVGYKVSKLSYVLDCKFYVDDDPRNLLEMVGIVPNLYIMTISENNDFKHDQIIRVEGWNELMGNLLREQ